MQTDLATIDRVIDKRVAEYAAKPTVSEESAGRARAAGTKKIAGFDVFDAEAERKFLDDMIAKRRAAIEQYRIDRQALRTALGTAGITPLAICPVRSWHAICAAAGLYVLAPDRGGNVLINTDFIALPRPSTPTVYRSTSWTGLFDYPSAAVDHAAARQEHIARLDRLFPNRCEPDPHRTPFWGWAKLVLPSAPADVAQILVKAQKFPLKMAAVADAIGFTEEPAAMWDRIRGERREAARRAATPFTDAWAQARGYADMEDWRRRDPIVFTEAGTAAAVIAQFGDFPIEIEAVEKAMATDDLIGPVASVASMSPSHPLANVDGDED